jgi:hypothetical protein
MAELEECCLEWSWISMRETEDIKACLQYAAAQGDHSVLKVP